MNARPFGRVNKALNTCKVRSFNEAGFNVWAYWDADQDIEIAPFENHKQLMKYEHNLLGGLKF